MAIIDVYSRFIVGWSQHNTLDASNCTEVLSNAIAKYGAPEIINSDQGRQFPCLELEETCAEHPEMRISMDGRGRAKDNIWIERFWRTINNEYIYIQPEENGALSGNRPTDTKQDLPMVRCLTLTNNRTVPV